MKVKALFNNSVGKCCLHSFYIILFNLLSLQCQHPLLWSESELTTPGMKVPGNIRSQEQRLLGTFFPRSKSSQKHSFLGAKVPTGNFHHEERKYRGAKSPDTRKYTLNYTRVGIIAGTAEWNDCVSFWILQEYDNLRNGTEIGRAHV